MCFSFSFSKLKQHCRRAKGSFKKSGELKGHSRSQQRPDDITCPICILHNYIVHVYYLNKFYDNEL